MLDFFNKVKIHKSRVGISLITQGVSSSANFFIGVYLVQTLSPDSFGWHSIGLAVALLYLGIGNALFLTQMIVRAPDITENERSDFYNSMLTISVSFNMIFAILIGLFLVLFNVMQGIDIIYISSIIFASCGYFANAFFLKYAYANTDEISALKINIITAGILISAMLTANSFSEVLQPSLTIAICGFSQAVGAGWGALNSKLSIHNIFGRSNILQFDKIIGQGKWALAGVAITFMQSQSYIYVTGLMLGVTAVATLNAGKIITTPFNFLLPALSNVILPSLARARSSGLRRIAYIARLYGTFLMGIGILYSVAVFLFGRDIIPIIIGQKYDAKNLLLISIGWCAVLTIQLGNSAASLALQAALKFKTITLLNILTAAFTVTATFFFIELFDIFGAILAVGMGEVMFGLALWTTLRRMQ